MRCLNCGEDNADQLFAGVLVCQKCKAGADELVAKAKADTQRLLMLLQEGIRIALIEQKFVAGSQGYSTDMRHVLQSITTLKEAAERRRHDRR